MVNRFVLNGISYHGKGAIQEIPGIIQSKGLQKAFIASDPDLIRFGVFTSEKYVWDHKGGVYAGAGVQSKFNIYPIPYTETSTNHNMQQNSGY